MLDHPGRRRAFALGWSALLVLVYHWFQGFPFANEIGVILTGAVMALAAAGAGVRLLDWARPPIHSELERWSFALCLGGGAMMLAVFLMAILGWLSRPALLGLPVALMVLGGRSLLAGLSEACTFAVNLLHQPWPAGRALAAVVVVPMLAWDLLHFPAPPTFYDSMVYHLALPAQYLLAGRYVPMPEDLYANLPANMGMLYTLALGLGGDALVNVSTWGVGVMLLVVLYGFAAEYFGTGAARLTVMAVAVLPLFQRLIVVAKDDLLLCVFGIAAIWAGFNAVQQQSRRWLVLCGGLIGLALGTRYFAAALALGLAAGFSWYSWRHRGHRCLTPGSVTLAAGLATLVVSPWLLRNQIEQGNPIYPLLASKIGSAAESPESEAGSWRLGETDPYLGANRAWLTSPSHWPRVILNLLAVLPWDLTMEGRRFHYRLGYLTPLLLIAVPLLLFQRSRPPAAVPLLLCAGVHYLAWALAFPRFRYLLPSILLLFPLAGWLTTRWVRWGSGAAAVVGMVWAMSIGSAGWCSLEMLQHISNGAAYTLASIRALEPERLRESYLESRLEYYPLVREINRRLPPEAVVLFAGELRSYYCQRRVRVNGFPEPGTVARVVEQSATPGEITARLRAEGISHLLWRPNEAKRLREAGGYLSFSGPEKEALFDAFLAVQRVVFRHRVGTIFELAAGAQASSPTP